MVTSGFDSGWIGAVAGEDLDRRLEAEEEPFDLRRPHVMTALGPIEPAALGVTFVHAGFAGEAPGGNGQADRSLVGPAFSLDELEACYALGGRAMAVVGTVGPDRDASAVAWLAARSPLHVVVATGARQGRGSDAEAVARIVRELTAGIEETGMRAGAIVVGSEGGALGLGDGGGRRAAAARRRTGAPVVVDAGDGGSAPDLVAGLRSEGVDPGHVVVVRAGGNGVADALTATLETGAFVAVDPLAEGRDRSVSSAAAIGRLFASGYGDQILLGVGAGRGGRTGPAGDRSGLAFLVERVPLLLMEAGLDAASVRRLLIDNPARALTIDPPTTGGTGARGGP